MRSDTVASHACHPGVGSATALMAAAGDDPNDGGFFVFLPSGATKVVSWRATRPIDPPATAARRYAAELAEALDNEGLDDDLDRTDWPVVTAAILRIILDWNERRSLH